MLAVIIVTVLVTFLVVILGLNFVTPEKQIERKVEHRYGVGRPAVPARDVGAARARRSSRGNVIRPAERRRDLPGDARRRPRRDVDDHLRDLHLLVGRDRPGVRRRAHRARARRRPRSASPSTGPAAQDGRRRCSSRWSRPACASSAIARCTGTTSAALNNRTHRKLLVVDGRIGFTGGVGIADQWQGTRAGSRALARHALPRRGPGRRAVPGGVQRQLDQDHRRGAERPDVLPALSTAPAASTRTCSSARPPAAARACT